MVIIKISTWLFVLFFFYFNALSHATESTTVTTLETSESKAAVVSDPLVADESKTPRSISKYDDEENGPRTYTIGYEAEDGSFKYESRVIKDTSFENSEEINSTSTTKPVQTSAVYSTSRSNVIQSIPRRKTASDVETTSTGPKLVYATSVPTSTTPRIVMPSSPHTRPILKNGIFVRSTIPPQNQPSSRIEGQLIRPVQVDSTTVKTQEPYVRKILISRQPVDTKTETQVTSSTERSVDFENTKRSNNFRRQLSPADKGEYESQQQILNYQQSSGDDTTDIYGNSVITGTQRPLFTTTPNARVLPSPRVRDRPYLRRDQLLESQTTQAPSTTEEPYQTQTSIPVISIPEYQKRYRGEYLRTQVEPTDQQITDTPEEQYLRQRQPVQFPSQEQPYRPRRFRPVPPQYEYPERYQPVQYQPEIASNTIPEDIQPPVTNRDFQRLLHQLIYVQAKLQQLAQIAYQQNPQNFDPILYQRIQQPLQPFPQPNRQPYPVQPYEQQQQQYVQRGPRQYLPVAGPQYPQEPQQYDSGEYDPRYQHHYQRRKAQYQPQEQYQQAQDYLPPEIREMLLLRMLQLAINSEIAATNQMEVMATTPAKVVAAHRHKGLQNPVRNVKILGEEKDQFKPTARSKRYQQDPNEDLDYYE